MISDAPTPPRRAATLAFVACLAGIALELLCTLPFLDAIDTWYRQLRQVPWLLSNEQMAPVALYFYGGVGYGLYRCLRLGGSRPAVLLALLLLASNGPFNAILFGFRSLTAGAVACIPYALLAVTFVRELHRSDRRAFLVMAPYLVWLAYISAGYLAMARLNA